MPTRTEALPLIVVATFATVLGLSGDWRSLRGEPVASVDTPAEAATTLGAVEPAGPIDDALDRAAPPLAVAERRALAAFYAGRGGRPLWSDGSKMLPQAERLLAALEEVDASGLDPQAYDVANLRRELLVCNGESNAHPTVRARQLADCDVALTRRFAELAVDLDAGRVTPASAGIQWHTEPGRRAIAATLAAAVEQNQVGEALAGLEPPHPGYRALRAAHASLLAVEARGGWLPLPETPRELAADPAGATKLRERLIQSGDLAPSPTAIAAAASSTVAIAAALRRFQARHGLDASGAIDAATLVALNVPAAERRHQVELNLERWRWLPESLGERYVEVNIPAYELEVVEHGVPTLAMRVVVGKRFQQTPAFSDEIEHLVLNPAWYVPSSIVANEILPAIEKDPDYLAKENMEVLGGAGRALQVRQRPGLANALGQIKFLLPNRFHVYLHDTPADRLFERRARSLSHGCVRLERPLDLAELLLRDEPGWNRERIEEAIATGETRSVPLSRPVPVHILYWTAWVSRDGTLQFRDDLYSVDAKLARALRSA